MKTFKNILLIYLFSLTFISCTSVYNQVYPTLSDGKYDSEFPYKSCSEQLSNISETIKLINCIAYYEIIHFKKESWVTKPTLSNSIIKEKGDKAIYAESTASGTGTIIFYDHKKIAFLTCAHIVDFEDTLYSYYSDPDGSMSIFLESIKVKKRTTFVTDAPENGELEILYLNKELDLAVLGKTFNQFRPELIPIFNYPLGKAKELEWGNFVYAFGYPMGYKTLTKALVSNPNRDRYGSFTLDAFFNRGFSGGIIFAVKDGVPNFELVGLLKSVPAEYELIIRPSNDYKEENIGAATPYEGELFVEKKSNIKYGLSKAIPIESIKEFFISNKELFLNKGFNFENFWKTNDAGN